MASPTPNKGYTYPAHGGSVNAWDSPLNTNFDQIDQSFGGSYNINCGSSIAGATFNSTYATVSSTTTTAVFPSSLALNLNYYVSGALTSNLTLTYPAVGSFYIIQNATSGGFSVLAKTAAGGSATVTMGTGAYPVVTDGTSPYIATGAAAFPSGTLMLFQQTAAPTGWTKQATHDNKALRVVTGAAGSGGTTGFTSVFTSRTIAQGNLPAINLSHSLSVGTGITFDTPAGGSNSCVSSGGSGASGWTSGGSGGSVTLAAHLNSGSVSGTISLGGSGTAMDFAVQYVDVIIASKN